MVVIPAGADNRYARPNTEVLTRLGQAVSADRATSLRSKAVLSSSLMVADCGLNRKDK